MASLWIVLASLACAALAGAQSTDLDVLANATNLFSQGLYQKIAAKEGQAVYSPYSIHSALSMTALGTRGRTLAEMLKVLGVSGMKAGPHDAYHELISQLNSATNVQVYTGNGVFTNPNMPINQSFVSDVQNKYYAAADALDFTNDGGPEKQINDYVAKKTKNLIKNILPPNSIGADAIMVLVNTVFFNGTWEHPFTTHMTQPANFTKQGGALTKVSMMKGDRDIEYNSDKTLKADMVRLPFRGNRFAMYIVLPQAVDGISELEQKLNGANSVNTIFEGYMSFRMHVEIPKFNISSTYHLDDTLKQMGMEAAFNCSVGDFSGMTPEKHVCISKVIHKATINVEEIGTLAAGGTVVPVAPGAGPKPVVGTVKIDHPFLFYLRDDQTKQVLFQGKFTG